MTKFVILVALAAISLGVEPSAAIADEVPTLDYRTTCHTAAQAGVDEHACIAGEEESRGSLAKEWAQYPPEDKKRCTEMSRSVAGADSYTELFACLRAAKAVKSLPKDPLITPKNGR